MQTKDPPTVYPWSKQTKSPTVHPWNKPKYLQLATSEANQKTPNAPLKQT